MTNPEIILAAFNKANLSISHLMGYTEEDGQTNEQASISLESKYFPPETRMNAYRGLIANHKFAKAFWGEETITDNKMITIALAQDMPYKVITKIWQYHLQQMVLEENPLKYLEKFL